MPPKRNARRRGSTRETRSEKKTTEPEAVENADVVQTPVSRGRGKRKAAGQLHNVSVTPVHAEELTDTSVEMVSEERPPVQTTSRRVLRSGACSELVEKESSTPLTPKRKRACTRSRKSAALDELSSPSVAAEDSSALELQVPVQETGTEAEGSVSECIGEPPSKKSKCEVPCEVVCLSDRTEHSELPKAASSEMVDETASCAPVIESDAISAEAALAECPPIATEVVNSVSDESFAKEGLGEMKCNLNEEPETALTDNNVVPLACLALVENTGVVEFQISDAIHDSQMSVNNDSFSTEDVAVESVKNCSLLKSPECRLSVDRMSRDTKDCLSLESEEDFTPDYDEDERHDALINAVGRNAVAKTLSVVKLPCAKPVLVSAVSRTVLEQPEVSSKEEAKRKVSSKEEPKREVNSKEETKKGVSSKEETKKDVSSKEGPKRGVSSKEETKKEVTSKEEMKKDVSSKEGPKRGVSSNDEAKKEVSSKEAKKEVSSKEEAKREVSSKEVAKSDCEVRKPLDTAPLAFCEVSPQLQSDCSNEEMLDDIEIELDVSDEMPSCEPEQMDSSQLSVVVIHSDLGCVEGLDSETVAVMDVPSVILAETLEVASGDVEPNVDLDACLNADVGVHVASRAESDNPSNTVGTLEHFAADEEIQFPSVSSRSVVQPDQDIGEEEDKRLLISECLTTVGDPVMILQAEYSSKQNTALQEPHASVKSDFEVTRKAFKGGILNETLALTEAKLAKPTCAMDVPKKPVVDANSRRRIQLKRPWKAALNSSTDGDVGVTPTTSDLQPEVGQSGIFDSVKKNADDKSGAETRVNESSKTASGTPRKALTSSSVVARQALTSAAVEKVPDGSEELLEGDVSMSEDELCDDLQSTVARSLAVAKEKQLGASPKGAVKSVEQMDFEPDTHRQRSSSFMDTSNEKDDSLVERADSFEQFEELAVEDYDGEFDEFDETSESLPLRSKSVRAVEGLSFDDENCDADLMSGSFSKSSQKDFSPAGDKPLTCKVPSPSKGLNRVGKSPAVSTAEQSRANLPIGGQSDVKGGQKKSSFEVATNKARNYMDDFFKELLMKEDWPQLAHTLLNSKRQNQLCAAFAECFVTCHEETIQSSYKKLVTALEGSTLRDASFRRHIIGLVGNNLIERCLVNDAFEVVIEMLRRKIFFYLSLTAKQSASEVLKRAVCVCLNLKRYDAVGFLMAQFNYFRVHTKATNMNMQQLIKQKYCLLNVVLVEVVKELPKMGQEEDDGKQILCRTAVSILEEILKHWLHEVTRRPEVAELIDLPSMFEFLVHGCIVHRCVEGLNLLSRLQENHSNYLEWKPATLREVIRVFLELNLTSSLLSDEQPLNYLKLAVEHKLLPKIPEYIPLQDNVLLMWPTLSNFEMRLVICAYLKSIYQKTQGSNVKYVPFSIHMIDRQSVFGEKVDHSDGMDVLQQVLSKEINPPLRWSKLSPHLLHMDSCSLPIVKSILHHFAVALTPGTSPFGTPVSGPVHQPGSSGDNTLGLGQGDVDFRVLWNQQQGNNRREAFSQGNAMGRPNFEASSSNPSNLREHGNPVQTSMVGPARHIKHDNYGPSMNTTGESPFGSSMKNAEGMGVGNYPARGMQQMVPGTSRSPRELSDFSSNRKVLLKTPIDGREMPQLIESGSPVATPMQVPCTAGQQLEARMLLALVDPDVGRPFQHNQAASIGGIHRPTMLGASQGMRPGGPFAQRQPPPSSAPRPGFGFANEMTSRPPFVPQPPGPQNALYNVRSPVRPASAQASTFHQIGNVQRPRQMLPVGGACFSAPPPGFRPAGQDPRLHLTNQRGSGLIRPSKRGSKNVKKLFEGSQKSNRQFPY